MNNNHITWIATAQFYQIYPLGLCGAEKANDFQSPPVARLELLTEWIPHIKELGGNALYLGPVFESDFHGYDTADYLTVDRRLGTNDTLKTLISSFQASGIKMILDTVFNHTGRHFFAFLDLKLYKGKSRYINWFCKVDFEQDSVYHDGFSYEGWYDAYNLVRLNLENPDVRQYLFGVVSVWISEFGVDGLRLDVAEIMDKQFLKDLAAHCRTIKPDIFLLGEVIMGDYNAWANDTMLDSTTNYEAYKALHSSHNNYDYHELAGTLNRQFGKEGVYRQLRLYNFADNHDTTRLASILSNAGHIFPLYTILLTMPGLPSIYYGSEWGVRGIKGEHEDDQLRPAYNSVPDASASPLFNYLKLLFSIRQQHNALIDGQYREVYVSGEQFVFERYSETERVIIAVNASGSLSIIMLSLYDADDFVVLDCLDNDYRKEGKNGVLSLDMPAYGSRVLSFKKEPTPLMSE